MATAIPEWLASLLQDTTLGILYWKREQWRFHTVWYWMSVKGQYLWQTESSRGYTGFSWTIANSQASTLVLGSYVCSGAAC